MGLWGAIKKAINSDLSLPLDANLDKGFPLQNMFGWAGGRYPFAGASDVTISANTTWDNTTHPQGFAKVKKLTINASRTLTIRKSPFFIFAEEIVGGGANAIIDASGPNGASSGSFTCEQPWGATAVSGSGRAQGGCGGAMLFIICNKFSGTAITIKANGGDGYSNTSNASTTTFMCGQGAFSYTVNSNSTIAEKWDGSEILSDADTKGYLHHLGYLLAPGGGNTEGGTGGGSGNSSGGGSGIGGGGSCINTDPNGWAAKGLNPFQLITLAFNGCRGGGGGAARIQTTGSKNAASGGGGGAILVYANEPASVTPTLEANGGTASAGGSLKGNGGAGIAIYVNFAA